MELKQFIEKIGGYTDENMKVIIRRGAMDVDDGRLVNIRARLKNKYYAESYENWHLAFFNIGDGVLFIQLTPKED